jgi:hypothetical protein
MSCANPTHARSRVPLRTPERHRGFLLETFRLGRAALAESLARPERLPDRGAKQREADTYERLIEAVGACEIAIPDPDALRVVEAVRDATDADNEYGRVVAEHAALIGLLDQLGRWS